MPSVYIPHIKVNVVLICLMWSYIFLTETKHEFTQHQNRSAEPWILLSYLKGETFSGAQSGTRNVTFDERETVCSQATKRKLLENVSIRCWRCSKVCLIPTRAESGNSAATRRRLVECCRVSRFTAGGWYASSVSFTDTGGSQSTVAVVRSCDWPLADHQASILQSSSTFLTLWLEPCRKNKTFIVPTVGEFATKEGRRANSCFWA